MIVAIIFTCITVTAWTLFLVLSLTRFNQVLRPYYFLIGIFTFSSVLLWLNRSSSHDHVNALGKYVRIYSKALLVTISIVLVFYMLSLFLNNAFSDGESPYMAWVNSKFEDSASVKIFLYIYLILGALATVFAYTMSLAYVARPKMHLPDSLNFTLIAAVILFFPAIVYFMEKICNMIKLLVPQKRPNPFLDLFRPDVVFENMQLWKQEKMTDIFKNFLIGLVIVLMTSSQGLQISITSQSFFYAIKPLLQLI